ncbi:MAG: AraC family transcriptional regulator [Desulfovibrionaceae bacterium]|nr:AraC family transcriptional regulator [Desulfovibrionaceae bacterium]
MPLEPILTNLEENIADDLSVERLAGAGRLSRTQLYREFYTATGHSVKEYVRKRRLSEALALIKHTDSPLTQIAHECGYGTEQALCKSVKAATGQTPAQYKANGEEYYFPACEGLRAQVVTVAAETIPPTLCLRYYDSRLYGIENRALAWLFASRTAYRGRIFGRNGKQEGAKLCYELYIESDDADQPAVSGTFAKTTAPNIEDEINAAWDYLYNGWLKTSMFAVSAGQIPSPWFEEYIHAGGQIKRLQLYLPVTKRPGFHKIRVQRCEEMHFLAASRSGPDAEKDASEAVVRFLTAYHPRLAQSARHLYVSTEAESAPGLRLVRTYAQHTSYTCGIQLQSPIHLPSGCGLQILVRPAGEYAVLEGDCCGDTGAYEAVLAAWMDGMGLRAAAAPFAVYEVAENNRKQDARANIYRQIGKFGTNG